MRRVASRARLGRYRRNHLVPVPCVADLAELNALLLAGCEADLGRRIDGRTETVGEAWALERPLLLALPAEPFDACESATPRVDAEVAGHDPSEPLLGPGRVGGTEGQRADRRARDHDQPLVAARSRAMSGCTASSAPAPSSITTSSCSRASPAGSSTRSRLAQERDRGGWPDCFDELWAALSDRYGRSDAARQMVDVLMLCRDHGPERVALAVRGALTAGAIDGRAVAVLARRAETGPAADGCAADRAWRRAWPRTTRARPRRPRATMTSC